MPVNPDTCFYLSRQCQTGGGGGGGCSGKHGGVRATRVWHGGVRGAAAAAAAAGKAARGRAAHGSAAAAAAQVRTRLRRGVKAVRGFRVGIERY